MAPKVDPTRIEYSDNHSAIFGPGRAVSAQVKVVLLNIFNRLRDLWSSDVPGPVRRQVFPNVLGVTEEFSRVTGFPGRTLRSIRKEHDDNDGILSDSAKRGPKTQKLEFKHADLEDWIDAKVEAAKNGGYLTLGTLRDSLSEEKNIHVSRHLLRTCLRRLGFRYVKRRAEYVSKRMAPHVQVFLRDHCAWVSEHVELNAATGKYVWTVPVYFMDESYIYTSEYRKMSWVRSDKTCDYGEKGKGTRIAPSG